MSIEFVGAFFREERIPAVAVGISIMGLASWGNIWLYFVANLAAGAAAAVVFKALNPGDK